MSTRNLAILFGGLREAFILAPQAYKLSVAFIVQVIKSS